MVEERWAGYAAVVDGYAGGAGVGQELRRISVPRQPAVPVEQACTEDAFQGLDLLRQRWPGNSQPRGGPAEIEFLGDGHEVAQLAQLHEVIVTQ